MDLGCRPGHPGRTLRARLAHGPAGGFMHELPRRIRPMGQRHAHHGHSAGLRSHRGAGGTGGRSGGIACALAEADRDAADGPDAKHPALRIFRADRIFLRNRARGGSYRNDHLRVAAHGALHRARDRTRSPRHTGSRPHVGLHAESAPVEGGDSGGPPHADGGTQPSHHADLRHGRHRIAHRGEGSRL